MNTILIVFKSNIKRALNQKEKLMISIFLPLVAILFSMYTNYVGSMSINIGIFEKATFQEGKRIISLLENTDGINIVNVDERYMKTDSITGKYDGVIIFEKEFNRGSNISLDEYFTFYTVKDKKIITAMSDVIKKYIKSEVPVNMEDVKEYMDGGSLSKAQRTMAFLSMILIITAVINGAVIIRDKYENTIARFMYSPNKRIQYMLGNIMYCFMICYLQMVLAIIISNLLGMDIGLSLGMLLFYGIILSLLATTFGAFISCLFKKELHANIFAGAIGMILSLIGGAFISYEKMPLALQTISNITPTRWIIKSVASFQNMNTDGVSDIMVILFFCVVFSVAATIANKMQKVEF